MPSLRFVQAIAVNGTVTNLLNGSKFEFLPVTSMVEVYAVSDVADTNLELTLGNVIEFDQMAVPLFAAASGGPNLQDHRIGGGVGIGCVGTSLGNLLWGWVMPRGGRRRSGCR